MYRYILETTQTAYKSGRRQKTRCPNCNCISFVHYIDTQNHYSIVGENIGRCDKEINCGYHKRPEASESSYLQKTFVKSEIQVNQTKNYLTVQDFQDTQKNYSEVDLLKFLNQSFGPGIVEHCIKKYFVGASEHKFFKNDDTTHIVFWYLDTHKRPVNAKIMKYDVNNGSRIKDPLNCVSWLHYLLKKDKNKDCLFGLHLLTERTPTNELKTIVVVESEKTALICSYFFPEFTWLATGGKNNFKVELFTPLKHRKIILIPDTDTVELWRQTASELKNLFIKYQIINLTKIFGTNGIDFADLLTDKVEINVSNLDNNFRVFADATKQHYHTEKLTQNQTNVITIFYKIIPKILENFK